MTYLDISKKYFDAWNAHDTDAIVETFADSGTYCDPTTGEISGDAIGANAKLLWNAFPDLSFEIVSLAEAGTDRVVAEWLMKGTNTGSFQGLPPTGRSISLPGVDIIEIGINGIKTVKGYFDSKIVSEQLGLQVLVQPDQLGPFSFGYSVFAKTGKMNKPGAFGITGIWNSNEDTPEIRNRGRDIAKELLKMEGFIGLCLVRAGERSITISAWEHPEDVRRMLQSQTHNDAKTRFWDELAYAAFTSVWVPHHINPFWVRCTACNKMNDYEKNSGVCKCGQLLPKPQPYF